MIIKNDVSFFLASSLFTGSKFMLSFVLCSSGLTLYFVAFILFLNYQSNIKYMVTLSVKCSILYLINLYYDLFLTNIMMGYL